MLSTEPQMTRQILARSLYDGTGAAALADQVVTSRAGVILEVAPFDAAVHSGDLPEYAIVTPGLIDIQINGANDVQFNDSPDAESLRQIAIGAARGGTAWILPTFVTAHGQDYLRAMEAARTAIDSGIDGILGLHLEGPFLSPKRPGIHDPTAIRRITPDDIAALSQPFPGPLLLTLAPEEAPAGAIAALGQAGVTVFVGHSAAGYDQMASAVAEGLVGATHLYNAMSQMTPREPGVLGSVLGSDRLFAGLIADGHHVHWNNVALAIRQMGDRLCLVTDAMCTLAGSLQGFSMHGDQIFLQDGRLSNADGTLAGAHVAMDESLRNVIDRGLASPAQAVRMASHNPARALGLGDTFGLIRAGYNASLSTFDTAWQAQEILRA